LFFDRFLFVDWSASSKPKRGKDSIWIGEGTHTSVQTWNPATRREAAEGLRGTLTSAVRAGERVLIGFDFPYGYPAGLADALDGVAEAPSWRRTWAAMARLVTDDGTNRNNRFDVAAQLNTRLGEMPGPFWGHSPGKTIQGVAPIKHGFPHLTANATALDEFRVVERRLKRRGLHPKSCWQLHYSGSVGSQALVGLPRLAALRDDHQLAACSLVWPFETGFAPPPAMRPIVVHAEIWPGMLGKIPLEEGDVLDQAQVSYMVEWARTEDAAGRFPRHFEVPALEPADKQQCIGGEGWIIGVE
jgi:precorrin-8X/cobalt-precorrin-8 methylmutase